LWHNQLVPARTIVELLESLHERLKERAQTSGVSIRLIATLGPDGGGQYAYMYAALVWLNKFRKLKMGRELPYTIGKML
jgi:hypothetical protein